MQMSRGRMFLLLAGCIAGAYVIKDAWLEPSKKNFMTDLGAVTVASALAAFAIFTRSRWKKRQQIVPFVVVVISGGISAWLWKIGFRVESAVFLIICVLQIYDQIASAFNQHMGGGTSEQR